MPSFGTRSKAKLDQADPKIQLVMHRAIEIVDFAILTTYRNQADQDEAFRLKRSTKQWPHSKHNRLPSPAIDIAPWLPSTPHIDWRTDVALRDAWRVRDEIEAAKILENIKRWFATVNIILGVAHGLGIPMRSGGDWDRDFQFDDHRLIDLPHLELIE